MHVSSFNNTKFHNWSQDTHQGKVNNKEILFCDCIQHSMKVTEDD